MKTLLYFILSFLMVCNLNVSIAQCDPIEYSVFFDSGTSPVPNDLQTGDVECYLITPNFEWQVGAIWSNAPIDLQISFEYSYYVMLGFSDENGADGIVFVLSADPAGQAAIGEAGGSLSYGGIGGISPSIALEFDTWNNGSLDPWNDHAMLHFNGVMDGSAGPAIDLGNIEDGQYHLVEVTWDAVGMNLTIKFDAAVIIDENIDLINDVFGGDSEVLIGFTGSTGGNSNTQIICDIQVVYTEVCNGVDDDCDGIIDEDTSQDFDQEVFICEGEVYSIGSSEYTVTGQYSDVFQNVLGCDSIVNTDLTVGAVLTYADVIGICEGEEYTQGSSTYTVSGTYFDVYQNSESCDSIIQTELMVNPISNIQNQASICDGELYQEGSSFYSVAGTYVDAYMSESGCDSVVTTVLDVLNVNSLSYAIEICEGEVFSTEMADYSDSGVYDEVYVNMNGCDSVVQLSLLVNPAYSVSQSRFICSGGSFDIGSSSYSEAGVYIDVFVAASGCDSIITTDLGVIDELVIPDSVLCEDQSFFLDMNPFPFHEIVGPADIQDGIYYFDQEGDYSVSVDLDGCILSDDFQLGFLSLFDTEFQEFELCSDESMVLEGRILSIDHRWLTGELTESITVFNPGEYIKEYEYQCGDFQDRFLVKSKKCNCSVYMPAAFTPDGDGVNEFYGAIYDCEFSQFEFSIYDRYGARIFYSTDPESRWNGGMGQYFVSPGIYHWVLKYSSVDPSFAKDVLKRGMVTVVR